MPTTGETQGCQTRAAIAGPLDPAERAATRVDRLAGLFAVGVLVALVVAGYAGLFAGQIPVFMDPMVQAYPYHHFLARSLEKGQLPLWNPHQFSGTPFASNPQAGIFYPPRLLLALLLPVDLSFAWLLGCHYLLAALAAYAWLRELRLSRSAAVLGSAALALGGQYACGFALPPVLMASAWLPVCFYCVERAARRRRWQPLVAAGAAMGAMLLVGYPRLYVFSFVWLPLYAAVRLSPLRFRRPTWGAVWRERLRLLCAALAMLYILLLLVWLLSGGPSPDSIVAVLRVRGPQTLIERVLLFGFLAALLGLGRPLLSGKRLRLMAVGLTALLTMAVLTPLVQLALSTDFTRHSTQVGAVEGRYTDSQTLDLGDGVWNRDLWLGDRLDVGQSLFMGVLPWGLVVFGLATWTTGRRELKRDLGLLAALALCVAEGRPPSATIWRLLPPLRLFPALYGTLPFVQLALAGLAAIGCDALLRSLARSPRLARGLGLALPALAAAQLLLATAGAKRFAPAETLFERPWTASILAEHAEEGRFMALGGDVFSTDYDDPRAHVFLVPNLATLHGLYDISGYDPLQLARYKGFVGVAGGDDPLTYPGGDRYHYVIVDAPSGSRLLDLLALHQGVLRTWSRWPSPRRHGSTEVFDNPSRPPRAYAVGAVALAPDPDLAARWVNDGLVEPSETLVLDARDPGFGRWGFSRADAPGARLSVLGGSWAMGPYARLTLGDEDLPPRGPGLNIAVVDVEAARVLDWQTVAPGDDVALEAVVTRLAARWPVGTPVALFSAEGFSIGRSTSRIGCLGALGLSQATLDRFASPQVLAVAAVGWLGARPGEALVEFGTMVARVDLEAPAPRPKPLGGAVSASGASVSLEPRSDPDRIAGRVMTPGATAVVVSEVLDEGWRAWLDGVEVPLARAYGLIAAFPVPAGSHRFELVYRPRALGPGLVGSVASIAVGLGAVVATRRRLSRRSRAARRACR